MKLYNYIRIVARAIPLLLPLSMQAQELRIEPGAQVTVSDGASLVLHNTNLINNGQFTSVKGSVVITGDASSRSSYIGGSRPLAFYTLIIDREVHDVILGNNIDVSGSVVMSNGNLQLNRYTLDLGTTGNITGERSSSFITGTKGGEIKAITTLYANQPVNPGNIGVEINSRANTGVTTIIRGHEQQYSGDGLPGIQRYFDITPAGKDLQASLRFFYLPGELAGNNGNALSVLSNNNGKWEVLGKDKADAQSGWVLKNNIGGMSRFTLAVAGNKQFIQNMPALVVQTYPNPARDAFTVSLTSSREKDVLVSLYDQYGHFLETRRVHCQPGVNRVTWDIQRYAVGSYQLVFNEPSLKSIVVEKQ